MTERKCTTERTKLETHHKEIFMNIVKHTDGGKLEKIIKSKSMTPQVKHDVWKKVTSIFLDEVNLPSFDSEKARRLYWRIISDDKKKYDSKLEKEFKKTCSKTGGGKVNIPDFDDESYSNLDDDEVADYNDPIHTDWNQVTRSKEIFKDSPKNAQSISQLDLPVNKSVESKQSAIVSSGSFPHDVIKISNSTKTSNQNNRQKRSDTFATSVVPHVASEIELSTEDNINSNSFPHNNVNDQSDYVLISTPDGQVQEVKIISTDVNTSRTEAMIKASNKDTNKNVVSSKINVKDMKNAKVDAATTYYTEMLVGQSKLMKLQENLYKEKIKTEKMKQQAIAQGCKIKYSFDDSNDDDDMSFDFI